MVLKAKIQDSVGKGAEGCECLVWTQGTAWGSWGTRQICLCR